MSNSAVKTRWHLTQAAFDRLLALLSADREEAGEKYILLRRNLLRFFATRGFSSADDAADDVLNRLARKLEGGFVPEDAGTYALGIARLVALEIKRVREDTAAGEMPEITYTDPALEHNEARLECLEKCLSELHLENRRVIVRYYQGEKRGKINNRQKLADELDIPLTALRNRAVRLRDKLEVCIGKCLK